MGNDTIGALLRPFPNDKIKERPGHNGKPLSYIEGHTVILRMVEVFGLAWSFRVLEKDIGNQQVIVLGELRIGDTVKQAFGGSDITRARDGGQSVSVADDLKSAATDSLKKCATLLGVGLHLYGDATSMTSTHPGRQPHLAHNDNSPKNGNGQNRNGLRLSRKQLSFINRLAQNQGMDRGDLENLARTGFGKSCAYLTSREASDFIDQLQASTGAR